MNGILRVAEAHLLTALREKITLFWFLIFPLFLLAILTLIFGNMGTEGEISFAIAVVNLETDTASPVDFAGIIEGVFEQTGKPSEEGKEPLFILSSPASGETPEDFLAAEKKATRYGDRAAVIVIPAGFNQCLLHRMIEDGPSTSPDCSLTIYVNEGDAASGMATSIIDQVLAGVERDLLTHMGRFEEEKAIPTETVWVGSSGTEVRYVDFLLPGIVLMGFFVNGLFGVPGSILFARDKRVLRRYWVTPLTVAHYLAGFSVGHLMLCLVQFTVLLLFGRFALGATVTFFQPMSIVFLLLAAITFLAFGFFVASVAKTANTGMAIANILNMPMMFLGGLFFPVAGLPLVLRMIVYVNPLTYLVKGLRVSLGTEGGMLSVSTIVVPLVWIGVCAMVASLRLSWDVER